MYGIWRYPWSNQRPRSSEVVAVQLSPAQRTLNLALPCSPHEHQQNVQIRTTQTVKLQPACYAGHSVPEVPRQRALHVQLQGRGRSVQVATESDADVGKSRQVQWRTGWQESRRAECGSSRGVFEQVSARPQLRVFGLMNDILFIGRDLLIRFSKTSSANAN